MKILQVVLKGNRTICLFQWKSRDIGTRSALYYRILLLYRSLTASDSRLCCKILLNCFRFRHPVVHQIKLYTTPSGLTWHANHTMHHKLPYCFFSMVIVLKVVWPVNDFNGTFYGNPMIFMFFLIFFSKNNFQLFIYLVLCNSKVLKTSRLTNGSALPQVSKFNFARFC